MTAAAIARCEPPSNDGATLRDSSPAPAAGKSQVGFVDLINLLLTPQETPIPADLVSQPQAANDGDPNLSPVTRSPHEIAGALIKAMSSNGEHSFTTNAFLDSGRGKLFRQQRAFTGHPLAEGMGQIPAPVLVPPDLQPNLRVEQVEPKIGTSVSMNKLRARQQDATPSGSSLAFSLRLTPKEADASAPGGFDVNTPSEIRTVPHAGGSAAASTQSAPESQTREASDIKSKISQDEIGLIASSTRWGQAADFQASDLQVMNPRIIGQAADSSVTRPSRTAAEALRSPAPDAPVPASQNSQVQGIAVRIARPEASVDLQVSERGGQVHVAVRTPDAGLQSSLRQDIGTLVSSLDRAGFHAEAAIPHAGITAQASAEMNGNGSHQPDSNPGSGRHSGGQPQGQQQQRQPEDTTQAWMEVMENAE